MRILIIIWLCGISTLVWAEEGPFVYNDHGKRDPFWNLVTPSGNFVNYDTDLLITDLMLEGVVVSYKGNVAIINGRMVKTNDKVGQYSVSTITKDSVTLIKDQERFDLRLKKREE